MNRRKVFVKEGSRKQRRIRIAALGFFFLLCFSVITYRCLYLHLATDSKLSRIARKQYKTKVEEAPPRGNIYDASGEELAVSVPCYSVAARPAKVREGGEVKTLSTFLQLPKKELETKLDPGKKYVWLKRQISPQEKEQLEKLNRSGIEFIKGSKRFYPNREVGSQILGAVGLDNEGLSGLELFHDRILRGPEGENTTWRDARGKTFETEETLEKFRGSSMPDRTLASGPVALHLTLRKNIQYATEKELFQACDRTRALSCTAIVMDPATGAILAMASYPNFNPNAYRNSRLDNWRNRAVTDTFEPGSTFKTILAAAALDQGAVRPEDRFFCENGAIQLGKHVIHDHEKYGNLSFREIVKVSSNIGIFKVGRRLGRVGFAETIDRFGFGRKTGIDYPGEVGGYLPPVESWQEIEFATLSFGQGIRVTPLQLATGFAVIANRGRSVTPFLVSHTVDPQGRILMERQPEEPRRILKEETAETLMSMLEEVTQAGGTATRAAIPGYRIAGKTGTAQKVVNGAYSHTKFVSSFVGIVPAENPRLVILVTIDEPKGVVYGGLVAAPVFQNIAWASVVDLGIPPSVENPLQTASMIGGERVMKR